MQALGGEALWASKGTLGRAGPFKPGQAGSRSQWVLVHRKADAI